MPEDLFEGMRASLTEKLRTELHRSSVLDQFDETLRRMIRAAMARANSEARMDPVTKALIKSCAEGKLRH